MPSPIAALMKLPPLFGVAGTVGGAVGILFAWFGGWCDEPLSAYVGGCEPFDFTCRSLMSELHREIGEACLLGHGVRGLLIAGGLVGFGFVATRLHARRN